MATVSGFKLFPLIFDRTVIAPHYLYIKKHTHQKNNVNTPPDRTIFIVNVPPYCTEKGLRKVLKDFGPIESVFIQQSPGQIEGKQEQKALNFDRNKKHQFQVAYVVFKAANSVAKLLSSNDFREHYISTDDDPIKTGIAKWCSEYKQTYPNQDNLQKQVDKYMQDFDLREEKEKELERQRAEQDEDGWTLVTNTGKNKGVAKEKVSRKEKKKKKEKELINFYSFQQRETKREHIAQLRKKFEEDKKRIEIMRSARKFKPF